MKIHVRNRNASLLLVLTLLVLPYQNCSVGGFAVQESLNHRSTDLDDDPSDNPDEIHAPTNLIATSVTVNLVQISWIDESDNEEGFYIERSADGGVSFTHVATVAANLSSHSIDGLNPNSDYHFRVRAYLRTSSSTYSNTIAVTTLEESPTFNLPLAPSGLVANVASTTRINLSWIDNSTNESGLYLERRTGAGAFMQIAQLPANTTSYANTGLAAATAYSYRVRAYNAAGTSAFSPVVTATTQSPSSDTKQVIMAIGHVGRTVMSCDGGLTWINDRSDNPLTRCWDHLSPNNVECDHTPNSGRGIDAGDGHFYANFGWGYNGSIRRTADGVNWTTVRSGGWGGGVAYYGGTIWSLWNGNSARSINGGATWINLYALISAIIGPTGYRAGGLFIAAGHQENFALSRDLGVTWEIHNTLRTNAQFFVYGNGVHIYAGGSSVSRSTNNGVSWTHQPNAISGSLVGLVHTGTHFVGWTSSAKWQSTDGINWSQTPISVSGSLPLKEPIVYNSESNSYVAIPNEWGSYYEKQKVLYSQDGNTWNQLGSTAFKGGHPITRMTVGAMDSSACP